MTGKEYIDRLIEDIKASIEVRSQVRSVEDQIASTATGNNDLGEFVSALNVGSFDAHLDVIVQMVGTGLLTRVTDGGSIQQTLIELTNNVDAVISQTDYILNDNMISTGGEKPSALLAQQFDWAHEYAR